MSLRLAFRCLPVIILLLAVCMACKAMPAPQVVGVAGSTSAEQPTSSPTAHVSASPRATVTSLTSSPSSTPAATLTAVASAMATPGSRPSPSATPLAIPQQVAALAMDAADVAWSRTGEMLAVIESPVLRWLDGGTLAERGTIEQGPGYMAVALGPEGLLAIGAGDNTVQLWNADTGALTRVLEGPNRPVEGTAYNPAASRIVDVTVDTDGVLIAAAVQGYYEGGLGSVWLWDVASGEVLAVLGLYGPPSAVAFGPAGAADASSELLAASTLVNSCGRGGGGITLWDTATQEVVSTLSAQGDAVTALAFRPDGKGIVGIGPGTGQGRCLGPVMVHEWELATGVERLLAVEGTKPTAVAYHPVEGALLVGHEDGTLRLWPPEAEQPALAWSAHRSTVRGVAFSPDGSRLVSWGADGQIMLWNWAAGAVPASAVPAGAVPASAVPAAIAPTPAASATTQVAPAGTGR